VILGGLTVFYYPRISSVSRIELQPLVEHHQNTMSKHHRPFWHLRNTAKIADYKRISHERHRKPISHHNHIKNKTLNQHGNSSRRNT
jgi:hypothetical protein